MASFKFAKTVPPPVRKAPGHWRRIAEQMQVNDSLLVVDGTEATGLQMALTKLYGRSSSCRKKEKKGYRVWRIK